MSNYQDQYGCWHDDDKINSQNVFVYGAYAKALGLDVSKYPVFFERCIERFNRNKIIINRKPGLAKPPLSHDECLGILYLSKDWGPWKNETFYSVLKANHFCYYGHGVRLENRFFERLLAAMIELMTPRIVVKGFSIKVSRPNLNDRNRWWKANLTNVKHFATRLHPGFTYIVKKYYGKKYHIEEEKLWAFFRDCETKNKANNHGEYSRKNLLWLLHIMNGDENRAKKLKPWVYFEKYFGPNHDFSIAIRKKYGIA